MADEDTFWALKNFQTKLEKITNLKKGLSSEHCSSEQSSVYQNESCSHSRSHSIGRSINRIPQSARSRSQSSDRNSFASTPPNIDRFIRRRSDIGDRLIEMKTICECLNEFERCVLKKSNLVGDLTKADGTRTSRDESTSTDLSGGPSALRPITGFGASGTGPGTSGTRASELRSRPADASTTENRPGTSDLSASELRQRTNASESIPGTSGAGVSEPRSRISGASATETIPSSASARIPRAKISGTSAIEPRPGTSADRTLEQQSESNQQNFQSEQDAEPDDSNANLSQQTNDSTISDISFDPSMLRIDSSDDSLHSESDSIPRDYRPLAILELDETDNDLSSKNIPRSGSLSSRNSASNSLHSNERAHSSENPNAQKQDLESALRRAHPDVAADDLPSSPAGFPVVSPPEANLAAENEQNKRLLEEKLNRIYELKRAYYSDPSDDMPYIDVRCTKHGVFTDEPIEMGFVYEEYETVPRCGVKGSNIRCSADSQRQSRLMQQFTPLQLDSVTKSLTFPGYSDQKNTTTNYTEWVDRVIEENVLHEFERKVDQLSTSKRMTSSSSDTSSVPERVSRGSKKINIPKKSLHFRK